MILLNFSHPVPADLLAQVEASTGQPVARMLDIPVQIDGGDLPAQVRAIVDGAGLSPREWQTLPLLVNPPGYAPAAAVLLAELHGRMGYWPPILWVRAVPDSTPPRFEVAKVISLQAVRDAARQTRHRVQE